LHKDRDEENLHSRFISYLLSSTSGHGMNYTYSELFIRNILKLSSEEFDLSGIKVLPNEKEKSEYKHIDILIVNKARSQAIIIENKIDAKDSNNESKRDGYMGQLERYYNTIQSGIDKDGNPCAEYQCSTVYVYYLSNNKNPSDVSIGVLKDKPDSWRNDSVISYEYHVREWLRNCIENTPEDKILVKEFIQHYLNHIDKMTHNDIPREERIELKSMVAENILTSKYLIENFKHVKWHTIHEFWTDLYNQLDSANYNTLEVYPKSNLNNPGDELFKSIISEVATLNKDINHGIVFDLKNGTKAYISSFGKLTWGIVEPKMWADFESKLLADISFSNFTTENTYNLIDKEQMKIAVKAIIEEISEAENNTLLNLKA
ncbi:MAG: hypothetical protein EOO43_00365, partial [Flavobacterium sp.]